MKRTPSRARLLETFADLDAAGAALIKRLCSQRDDPDALRATIAERCPTTAAYVASMRSDPYDSKIWRTTVVLHAVNELCGTHGVEVGPGGCDGGSGGYAPRVEYLNAGDPYASTLIYRRSTDTISIGSWGDLAERSA